MARVGEPGNEASYLYYARNSPLCFVDCLSQSDDLFVCDSEGEIISSPPEKSVDYSVHRLCSVQ